MVIFEIQANYPIDLKGIVVAANELNQAMDMGRDKAPRKENLLEEGPADIIIGLL